MFPDHSILSDATGAPFQLRIRENGHYRLLLSLEVMAKSLDFSFCSSLCPPLVAFCASLGTVISVVVVILSSLFLCRRGLFFTVPCPCRCVCGVGCELFGVCFDSGDFSSSVGSFFPCSSSLPLRLWRGLRAVWRVLRLWRLCFYFAVQQRNGAGAQESCATLPIGGKGVCQHCRFHFFQLSASS